jgi:transcriptional regulator with XRE-family HTH domain
MIKIDKEIEHKLIKERIDHYLKQKNMTENNLAKVSGITQSTINGIMNKKRIPRIDTIHAICIGLNISVKEFFDFSPFDKTKETEVDLKKHLENLKNQIANLEDKINNRE